MSFVPPADGEQTLCLTYLWDEAQIKSDGRTEMLSALLEMNVPLPLSSFGNSVGGALLGS